MANVALILGPIVFKHFEVLAGVIFGGSQRLAVHNLLGGNRTIDTMGRDDATLQFSGIFSGGDATLRVRALNELRAAGFMLPLTWDVFFYTVIISDFVATYENTGWITYKIVCTVVRDEASALIQPVLSLAANVLADAVTAGAQATLAGLDLSGSQSALAAAGATTRGTAAYTAAQDAVSADQANISSSLSGAQSMLGQMTSVIPTGDAGIADTGVVQLNAAVSAAQNASMLTVAQNYLNRIATNLSNAST